jgi:ABC-type uncharacterized transport system permease subunit
MPGSVGSLAGGGFGFALGGATTSSLQQNLGVSPYVAVPLGSTIGGVAGTFAANVMTVKTAAGLLTGVLRDRE